MTRTIRSLVWAAFVAVASIASGQTQGEQLDITAFAVNMSNIWTGASVPADGLATTCRRRHTAFGTSR